MCLCYCKACSLHTIIVLYDLAPTVTIPLSNDGLCFLVLRNTPPRTFWIRAKLGPRQFWQADSTLSWHSHTQQHSRSLTPSLPDMGVSQTVLFAGAGLALLQTMGVTGLATQITDGFIEAVRQHGQLATMTERAGSRAWTATMLAAVGLLETEETL